MELTDLDKELLDGLKVLTDEEISRVQAHLAAGLPMQIDFGWKGFWRASFDTEPACFGCLIGTAMSADTYFRGGRRNDGTIRLALDTFPGWVTEARIGDTAPAQGDLGPRAATKLAALLDLDWQRRHPLPAEYKSGLIEPALENKPALMEVHA